jgi:hypothetical protein
LKAILLLSIISIVCCCTPQRKAEKQSTTGVFNGIWNYDSEHSSADWLLVNRSGNTKTAEYFTYQRDTFYTLDKYIQYKQDTIIYEGRALRRNNLSAATMYRVELAGETITMNMLNLPMDRKISKIIIGDRVFEIVPDKPLNAPTVLKYVNEQ